MQTRGRRGRSRVRGVLRSVFILAMLALLSSVAVAWAVAHIPHARVPLRRTISFENVTVIQPMRSRSPGQTLRIAQGRIEAIEAYSGAAQEAAQADPWAGRFVLPGLVDLHVHYPSRLTAGMQAMSNLLFLVHGVTTVRDLGAVYNDPAEIRSSIRKGSLAGPRIRLCGPIIDGVPPVHPFSRVAASAAEGEAIVEELASRGEVDCIKVYSVLSPEALGAIRSAAARHGLPVIGHPPERVPLAETGLSDVQHLMGIAEKRPLRSFPDSWAEWDRIGSNEIAELTSMSLRQQMAHTPTLVVYTALERLLYDADPKPSESDAVRFLPRFYRELVWDFERGLPRQLGLDRQNLARLRDAIPTMRRLVRAMHEAGVELHLGSDAWMPYVIPGQSLQQEMAEFVQSGIPLEQVWNLATYEAGKALGDEHIGELVVGAPADLLVFREDPTQDLAALDSLEAIVADGRLYRRAELLEVLERQRDHVQGALYETLMTPLIKRVFGFAD